MRARSLIAPLSIAAAAVLVICALQALAGAVAAGDDGYVTEQPDASLAAPANPESTMAGRAERRRWRRQKRLGQPGTETADGGASRDAGLPHFAFRDGGLRPAVTPPPPPVAPPPPPPPSPTPTGPSASLPISDLGFNTCHKIPAGKRAVKVNLKPDIDLPELVAWISAITCKSFVLPGHLSAAGKKVTIVTQGTMSPREAYATFLTALDSLGLTVEQGPGYLKVIETAKAKSAALPVYGFDGQPTEAKPRRSKPAASGN